MGHAPEEVGDLYSKLNDDTLFRQEWAESRLAPGYWTWLLSEAVARGDGERGPRRRRSDGPEPAP